MQAACQWQILLYWLSVGLRMFATRYPINESQAIRGKRAHRSTDKLWLISHLCVCIYEYTGRFHSIPSHYIPYIYMMYCYHCRRWIIIWAICVIGRSIFIIFDLPRTCLEFIIIHSVWIRIVSVQFKFLMSVIVFLYSALTIFYIL